MQKRIVALHNIDAPWNAADFMQALGRAERQGNLLNQIYDDFGVKSYNYVLKESFDAKVYDTLKHKQNILRSLLAKDSNINNVENVFGDIPFEQFAAAANGNELLTKKNELLSEYKKLIQERIIHKKQQNNFSIFQLYL